ncbi:MAG: sigma-70 family RNA polymerase sigma factor [Polyangiaceae bacterium]
MSQLQASSESSLGGANSSQFDGIYSAYFDFVWRCLRTLGVPERALDDAVQEVFIVVHRGLDGFRGDSSIRTWLYGIVRNVAYKQARTAGRKERAQPIDTELPSSEPTPSQLAEEAEAAAFVQRFAHSLDQKKREVFILAVLEQCTAVEVAEMTGAPLNTVYTRLRSVRAEFRAALERYRGPNE